MFLRSYLLVGWLEGLFVSRITQKNLDGFKSNLVEYRECVKEELNKDPEKEAAQSSKSIQASSRVRDYWMRSEPLLSCEFMTA